MSDDGSRRLILASFLLVVSVITWQEVKSSQVPRPKRFVSAGIMYGLLGLLSPIIGPGIAAMFGVGLVVALLYNTMGTGSSVAGSGQVAGNAVNNALTQQ